MFSIMSNENKIKKSSIIIFKYSPVNFTFSFIFTQTPQYWSLIVERIYFVCSKGDVSM